jgi:hypothetical protein
MIRRIVYLLLLLTLFQGPISYAGLPDIYTQYDKFLDRLSTRTYEVYFPYGSNLIEKEIKNKIINLDITSPGLEIDVNNVYDYYFTNEIISNNPNFPKDKNLDCTLIGKYKSLDVQKENVLKGVKIEKEFLTKNTIKNYKPQSKEILPPKANGCIGLTIMINPAIAKTSEIIELVFNENYSNSKDYEESIRPGTNTIAFIIGDNEQKCDITKGEVYVVGKCRVTCENNQTFNAKTGDCEYRIRECNEKEDKVNGNCLLKCEDSKIRDASTKCIDPTSPQTMDQLIIYSKKYYKEYSIITGVILLIAVISIFAIKKKRNNK